MFLTSPNNPDGSLIQEQQLTAILDQPVLVVLDEAYIEFADEPSRLNWVQKYDNLVVLRTFSKSAGLAGIRVGYGSFPLGMIEYLWRAKQPYNVSVASEVAACAALSNMPYLQVCWQHTCWSISAYRAQAQTGLQVQVVDLQSSLVGSNGRQAALNVPQQVALHVVYCMSYNTSRKLHCSLAVLTLVLLLTGREEQTCQ